MLRLLSLFFFLTACEKSYLGGRYKITGVLYDVDGKTSLANKELTLSGHNYNNFSDYSEYLKTVKTDKDGYFKFPYWHNNKAGYLRISHQGGVLLSSITPNEDLERDLCLKGIGYVHLDIKINRDLGEGDSLYLFSYGEETKTRIGKNGRNIILYPFEELRILIK